MRQMDGNTESDYKDSGVPHGPQVLWCQLDGRAVSDYQELHVSWCLLEGKGSVRLQIRSQIAKSPEFLDGH